MELLIALLAAAVQSGTPILYATVGEMLTERSGVLNLGVEGLMMVGAFTAFIVSVLTGSPWLAFGAGGLAACMLASLHGIVCIVFLGNQVVSGLALAILGVGLANYLGTPYIGEKSVGFFKQAVPVLEHIPVLGPVFFQQDVLVYLSYFLPLGLWFFLHRTRLGVHLDASGEDPRAAASAGLSPQGLRWLGVLGGGFLCGLGGAYLSLAYSHLWTTDVSAGRGWIAVALVIFAFWKPQRAILGAYLFGSVIAMQLRVQALGFTINSSVLSMLPYALTIGALIFSSLRGQTARAPGYLARNVEPEG